MKSNLVAARAPPTRIGKTALLSGLEEAAIIVDDKSEIVLMNAPAASLFEPGGALRLNVGKLTASRPNEAARLNKILTACWVPGVAAARLQLSHADGTVTLVIAPLESSTSWLLPFRAAALILANVPAQQNALSFDYLRKLFGLTSDEIAFATSICSGEGVAASARRLGICMSTARTHLAHIFDKTGTHRQAELVRLIIQSGGLTNGSIHAWELGVKPL